MYLKMKNTLKIEVKRINIVTIKTKKMMIRVKKPK